MYDKQNNDRKTDTKRKLKQASAMRQHRLKFACIAVAFLTPTPAIYIIFKLVE